jgi:sugar phosphate isomerase/epimerase
VNPSCASGINLANTNASVREDGLKRLEKTIEFIDELGGGILVLPPPVLHSLMPAPFEVAWGWVREGIERCARQAERYGVTIGLENSAAYRFFVTAGLLQRMVREVASDHVRLVYDVTNGPESEYAPAAIRQIADDLVLVHLSDRLHGEGHLPIGMGQVGFEAIADSLRAVGFQGVSVMEVTHPQASDGALLASAAKLEGMGWQR